MRKRWIVVTTAVHNRHLAIFIQAFKTGHTTAEAKMIVDAAQLLGPNAQFGPVAIIGIVTVRHEGVETIIASGEFQHHQNTIARRAVVGCGQPRLRQPRRQCGSARGTQP